MEGMFEIQAKYWATIIACDNLKAGAPSVG